MKRQFPQGALSRLVALFFLISDLASPSSSPLEAMVIPSLCQAGYCRFAAAVAEAYHNAANGTPPAVTFLASPDGALLGVSVTPEFVRCHTIADGALIYRSLVGLYPGTRLRTLHSNVTLAVTESQSDQRALVRRRRAGGCAEHLLRRPLRASSQPSCGREQRRRPSSSRSGKKRRPATTTRRRIPQDRTLL
ncbi:unnamed protein product [Spirodela intermedia]|uniref:Uncharacterized protein n=1 Tax=Spirodela intermedia TaxID=51605 RepID=A0A7I8IF32_SPIIN|nr:unnamed protein product [Spirodela intermedia]CAA6655713.1 unnamed protein product [Spirodela intermedia]